MRRSIPFRVLVILSCLACAGSDRARGPLGGTVIVAAAADADALIPALVRTSQGRFASELLFERLVEMGPSLNTVGDAGFEPRLARRWHWSDDSLAVSFDLDPRARWHDGQPVVAADVVAGFRVIRDPANGSSLRGDVSAVDSVTSDDPSRATVHFARRSAEQFYVASLIHPLPAHLLPRDSAALLGTSEFARHPVGSGPFRFVAWDPQSRLEFAAVEDHHRGRARLDRVVLVVSPEPATGLARLWAGEADVWELVPAADLEEAARYDHLRLVPARAFDYAYVAFNFRDPRDRSRDHPFFTDARLRRAISMAVDRDAIVRAIFDTLALVSMGPFVRAQHTADTTIRQIPADTAAAAALLDSLGWGRGGRDGIRTRGGRRLAFTALIPGSSRNRERAAVLMQEQLRRAGIAMEIERAENRTFTQKRVDGQFDVVFGGWLTTPSPRGVRGTWGSIRGDGWGAQNDGRYSDPAFDAQVDSGLATLDPADSRRHFRAAYQAIVDDAAAIFLYEPRNHAAVHRRIRMPEWRSDGWWRTIASWSIDPDERLPRDARPSTP